MAILIPKRSRQLNVWPSLQNLGWRLAYRAGFVMALAWWRVRRPSHTGAMVILRRGNELLLVRASYRRRWNFPGGGVKAGELPADAARREAREEIGLSVPPLGPGILLTGLWDQRRDQVHAFELWVQDAPTLRIDNREIVEARWFPIADLATVPTTGPVSSFLLVLEQRRATGRGRC